MWLWAPGTFGKEFILLKDKIFFPGKDKKKNKIFFFLKIFFVSARARAIKDFLGLGFLFLVWDFGLGPLGPV